MKYNNNNANVQIRDTKDYGSCRGVTPTSVPAKSLTRALEKASREKSDTALEDPQYGFRKGRSRYLAYL